MKIKEKEAMEILNNVKGVLADQCLYWRIVIFGHGGTMHNYISAGTMQKEYSITTGPSLNVRLTFLPITLLCSRAMASERGPSSLLFLLGCGAAHAARQGLCLLFPCAFTGEEGGQTPAWKQGGRGGRKRCLDKQQHKLE